MLVLERRHDEVILIGDNIRITVVNISMKKGGKVRIGIEAPAHLPVDRLEIRQQKEKENKSRGDWYGEE